MNNERTIEIWSMIALHCSPLLSNASIKQIIGYYGSATKGIQALNESIRAWSILGISNSQIHSFASNAWKQKAQHIWKKIQQYSFINILLSSDKEYPLLLKEIHDPPHILYYQGDVNLLSHCGIAVIGTRKASSYGKTFASSISTHLAEYGFSVISGLAEGIDAIAHRSTLDVNGKTIAVLGNGLDVIYPAKNTQLYSRIANEGCLLTEFPPTTPPKATHFPIRNRLVSGLSLGVAVIEAGIQSGTMITVKNALEQGRSVYAIPSHHLTESSTGNSYLLEEGAIPITTAQEIFEDLMPQLLHRERVPKLTQKLLEYQQSLSLSAKDYFNDMLHIFETSTKVVSTPQKKRIDKNFPNPIASPFVYTPISSPVLHYGEKHEDNTLYTESLPRAPSLYTESMLEDEAEDTYQEVDDTSISHDGYVHAHYTSPSKDSPLFTPILEQLFQGEESIAITTQSSIEERVSHSIEKSESYKYQSNLKEVLNNTIAYGLSTTAEEILQILHEQESTPEEIVQRTSLDAKVVTTELILLEVQGLIQKQAGGYYAIIYE